MKEESKIILYTTPDGKSRVSLMKFKMKILMAVLVLAGGAAAMAAANPLEFPSYEQLVEVEFATPEAAAAAVCEIAPLPGDASVAFSCRWDDSNPAHIAKGEMMNRAGVKGNFYFCGPGNAFTATGPKKLMTMGHAIGNHTVNHPSMMTLSPNAAFWNIATNRIALEVNTQHTITSYVSPFGWQQSPLDPEQARTVAACLVADGHFVSQDRDQPWSKLPSRTWMWTNRFAADDRNPQREAFVKGFRAMYAQAKMNRDVPRVTLGTHSWCDEQGNARQESWLKEFFFPEGAVQVNDWQYGAYRYQYFHGGVKKVSVSENRAVFAMTRYAAAYVGDDIALSLKFSSAPVKVALRGRALTAGERGTWTLPQDETMALMPKITDGSEALTVMPDEKNATLTLAFVNTGTEMVKDVYFAAVLPPKWSERRLTASCPGLKPGETFRKIFGMGEIRRADYAYGRAFYPVSVDYMAAGRPHRVWKSVETAEVEMPASAPYRAAKVWGPGPAATLADVDWTKVSVAGVELPDAANWKSPKNDRGDSLSTAVTFPIRIGRGKEGRALGDLINSGDHARYIVYDFEADSDGVCKLRFNARPKHRSPFVCVNGVKSPFTGDGQEIAVRKGRNRLVIRADAYAGSTSTDALYLEIVGLRK